MRKVVELLTEPRRNGYPAEYLLARLRSRKTGFVKRCPAGRAEEAWLELQKEYGWIFGQMEKGLRRELAPVFFYFELRNIFIALRFRAGEDRIALRASLEESLLGAKLKSILTGEGTFPVVLNELSVFLGRYDDGFRRLREAWQSGGMRNLETVFLSGLAGLAARENPSKVVGSFLKGLFERRNMLLLAKERHWQLSDSLFIDPWPEGNRRQLLRRLERFELKSAGISDAPDRMDNFLLHQLTKNTREIAGSSQAAGTILSYLFSCLLIARDCGVKSAADSIDNSRQAVEATP